MEAVRRSSLADQHMSVNLRSSRFFHDDPFPHDPETHRFPSRPPGLELAPDSGDLSRAGIEGLGNAQEEFGVVKIRPLECSPSPRQIFGAKQAWLRGRPIRDGDA